ncbi:MAG TPA: Na+/H+ antiporter NhaC family protein [Burkholderiaceae bacterium]|nr:Na+/H+ antiporter NhaC family protein [Burkholderiaceae bacterium]
MMGNEIDTAAATPTRRLRFPGAVTTLAIVTVLVWLAALFIPPGVYRADVDGSPIPGTYQRIESPLTPSERLQQLILAPVNGVYGLRSPDTEVVDTEIVGRLFGQIGIIVFIMSIGAFISVSFATRALEVAVAALAHRLRDQGWALITAVMVLFSALGSTMGFSVETLGFYALFLPLMRALGYDRLVTASMIILGALIGVMGATVNPFSIGVAANEAGVTLGEGIALRLLLWIVLTGMAVAWVLRYAARVRREPSSSLVGWDDGDEGDEADQPADGEAPAPAADARLNGAQKWVLFITAASFALMIFSVIPWSAVLGGRAAPADYYGSHEVADALPFWFELNWWFPELSMLFILASVLVGFVARLGEKETVRLISAGAADMMGPAMVVLLAGGVSAIMNNTQTMGTILHSMEQLVDGASAGVFTLLTVALNVPLAMLIPSSSGHGALAMPLLAPLADFAGVSRASTITAWIMGHGLALMFSPTSVVLVGGLAIAKVGYEKYLGFVWPLLVALFVVSTTIIAIASNLG